MKVKSCVTAIRIENYAGLFAFTGNHVDPRREYRPRCLFLFKGVPWSGRMSTYLTSCNDFYCGQKIPEECQFSVYCHLHTLSVGKHCTRAMNVCRRI